MSHFTGLEDWFEPAQNGYRTTKPVRWEIGRKGSGLWVEAGADFFFDVSVPSGLKWVFDPHDVRYLKAACLHDYALHVLEWDRVSAASVFHGGLVAQGVGKWERLAMVLGVTAWKWR